MGKFKRGTMEVKSNDVTGITTVSSAVVDEDESVINIISSARRNKNNLRAVERPDTIQGRMKAGMASEDEIKAFKWLKDRVENQKQNIINQRDMFGMVSITVDCRECQPNLVERIFKENGMVPSKRREEYVHKTGELRQVTLTFMSSSSGYLASFE